MDIPLYELEETVDQFMKRRFVELGLPENVEQLVGQVHDEFKAIAMHELRKRDPSKYD